MSYEINGAGGGAGGSAGAEWHQQKIRDYFTSCHNEIYHPFLAVSATLVASLTAFVNDDEHKGSEAEQSKLFVNERQIQAVEDAILDIQLLEGMMQAPGYDGSVPLCEDFIDKMSEDDTAVIKEDQLKAVITDFSSYNNSFRAIHPEVTKIRNSVLEAVAGCDAITITDWTEPKPATSEERLEKFVSTQDESGFMQTLYKNFGDFLEAHKDDITDSTFKKILDRIVKNLTEVIDGIGSGDFDIIRYNDTKNNIEWTNVKDILDGEDLQSYLDFLDSYNLYLQGQVESCEVYKYDPVNMNSGNYISDQTDLTVGGLHPIFVKRFYNAMSDRNGIHGKGWTTEFDVSLSKNENDDTIKALYSDGHEGIYKKETIGNEELYVEIHGEEGILKEIDTGYVIVRDNRDYEEFDRDGYLVGTGKIRSNSDYATTPFVEDFVNNKDEFTKLIYDTITIKGAEKAVPVKVETKEGSGVVLSYNTDGILVKVTDHTGREIKYSYESRKTETGEEATYLLTSVNYPDGSERSYSYDKDGRINTVTRPDGVETLINEYDKNGRIIHQSMPGGAEISFAYDDEKHITTATEQNGCVVEYLSDEIGRHVGTRYIGLTPGATTQDTTDSENVIEEKYTYNEKNKKTSITDRNGHVIRYSYDNRGHVTGVIGPEGLHESYTYNADGKLMSRKDSEGNQYKYAYDIDGNLYSVTDPLGNKVRFDYEDGQVVSIRDAENNRTLLTYDDKGNIKTVTDKAGVTTTYECDDLGRVIASVDADGNRTTYDFDVSDNLRRVIDPEGNITSYEYSKLGKVTSVTNPDGTQKKWEYNSIGKPAKVTDEENRTYKILYNASYQEDTIVLPNNESVKYEYDLLGNMVKTTDPDGVVTAFTYDNCGNVLTVKKSDDKTDPTLIVAYTYDARGRVKSETDGNGQVTRYEYDRNGDIVKVISANGAEKATTYDPAGRISTETDALGRTTKYTYDANGNIKTVTDPFGVVTENIYEKDRIVRTVKKAGNAETITCSYEYDSNGRLKRETETDGFSIDYTYTRSGRIASVRGSNGRVITYSYDSCGRVVETNDSGIINRYSYTGTGKLKSVTDALGNKTEYTFNSLDLISRVDRHGDERFPQVDGNGHVTSYEYSSTGRLLSVTDALGQQDKYSYDVRGNIKSHIDRDGYETIYTRDNNGNVIGIDYADGKSVKMSYNALNILEEVRDHLGLTKIESDLLGRMTSVTDYNGRHVGYEYGPYDNKSAVIYPDGKKVEYGYDAFGRLESLLDVESGKAVTYSYDIAGRLAEKVFPNGTKSQLEYYQGGLIKSLKNMDGQGILDEYSYKYDATTTALTEIDKLRRGMEAVSGTYNYEYDALGRLIKSTLNGNLRAEYKYDAFGNRIEMSEDGVHTIYEYDALDRLTGAIVRDSINGETRNKYSYDKRGNQTAFTSGDIVKKTFAYDAMGKMVFASDSEKGDVQYNYNGLGFRVEAIRPEEKIEYLTDISREYSNLLERTVNGLTETFLYDNNVVSMSRGGESYYYLQDDLGSTMYLTGTDGLTVDAYAYDDFGRRVDPFTGKLKRNGKHDYVKSGNIIQPFAFTGYQEDETSDLYYAHARYYDSSTGRFNSEDNVRGFFDVPETLNHYEYCWNNPTTIIDKDGNFGEWAKEKLAQLGQNIHDNKDTLIKTGLKIGAGVLIGVGCVFAAPVVAGAVATAFAATSASAAIATVVTAAAVGGAFSGTTSIVNQLIDSDFKKVDFKKVGIDTLTGALKGAAAGAIGVVGAGALGASKVAVAVGKFAASKGGSLVLRTVANAAIDIGSDWAKKTFIDGEKYTRSDMIKSGISSSLSTLFGEALSKFKPLRNAIESRYTVKFEDGKASVLFETLSKLGKYLPRAALEGYQVGECKGRIVEIMTAWLLKNFVNYERSTIQKAVQAIFGCSFPELAEMIYNKIAGVTPMYEC